MKIREFFRPAIIIPLPPGSQGVDPLGGAGYIQAVAQNANSYAQSMGSYATVTAPTIAAADVVKGVIQLNAGATGSYAMTLDTTDKILAALGASVPQDGSFTKIVRVVNNGSGQQATVTAGDGKTTVVGTATLANNTSRDFTMRVGPGSTLVFSNTGSLSL